MATQIISYRPEFKHHFISLNKAWLETFFYIEPHDLEVFENIEVTILKPGGEIFFCLVDNEVVGTVALQKVNETAFELAKLAVDSKFQGQKLSNLLMDACIAFAKEKKATTIMLFSNTKLEAAINLYKKYLFKEVAMSATAYDRTNIQMELHL